LNRPKENYLILENDVTFKGFSFGFDGSTEGEVVFTTGMTGYPESMTDPSYQGQILVFTYPMIGNYGIPNFIKDETNSYILQNGFESGNIQVRGVVISNYSFNHSHADAVMSLHDWMDENKIPGIYGADTRELTKVLRTKGVMLGRITNHPKEKEHKVTDPNSTNLASIVSVKNPIIYKPKKKSRRKILLIDCGVKNNIIRNFINRGAEVIRVPWDFNPNSSEYDFDGIFVSNGPGDPKMCKTTIKNLRESFNLNVPIFGICLGSQILSLSAGADTYKLKFGHRSQNQPCIEQNGKCYITSQNHGYVVSKESLTEEWEEWFVNNNDGTNEGVKHKTKPYFAVQFHPEATPGPNDTGWLFDMFLDEL
jgi:carbamoyl-phosphate synthase small subunit